MRMNGHLKSRFKITKDSKMKSRMLGELKDFTQSLHFIDSWPSIDEVYQLISESPQYRAVHDLGLPRSSGYPSLEHLLSRLTDYTVSRICDEWIEMRLHSCLSLDNLRERFLRESEGNAVMRGLNFELRPATVEEICKIYYRCLESKVFNTLYQEKQVYKYEELDLMIPSVDAPGYYDRDRIILSYLESMEKLKPRGKDWTDSIETLKSLQQDKK